jgi:hemin uptake protein HemP
MSCIKTYFGGHDGPPQRMKRDMSNLQSAPQSRDAAAAKLAAAVPHLESTRLLGEAGEAVIEHEGNLYRLRRTSRGGLVLTK